MHLWKIIKSQIDQIFSFSGRGVSVNQKSLGVPCCVICCWMMCVLTPLHSDTRRHCSTTKQNHMYKLSATMAGMWLFDLMTATVRLQLFFHFFYSNLISKWFWSNCCQKCLIVLNIWEMESSDYESYIQWLPREVVGDVISIITNE